MKIIIATPIYPPEVGGPATYTVEIEKHLMARGHVVSVLTFSNIDNPLRTAQTTIVDKKLPRYKRIFVFGWQLYRLAKHHDVIYVQNAMAAGLPAVIVGLLTRTPVVLKFVGDEPWERATQRKQTEKELHEFMAHPDGGFAIRLMRMIQGWVLRRAQIVTTPSAYLGELLHTYYGVAKANIHTNYNAAEIPTDAQFGTEKKPHQLVATARLVVWKGIDTLIEAVALLVGSYPDIKAIIHGDGPERSKLEALAESRGVKGNIVFTGNVSRTETWHTRQVSSIYILSSTYEGLPHTALTSFAARIPIIATNIPGTNEAVYHEKSGLLVPPQDAEALAAAIKRLFSDDQLSNALVAGGTAILDEKFSWHSHVATLELLLETSLTKPR
ncbi:MAG: glycosyltransferase family 4 protein [Candidatus Pacebacteria bacterium]|jgi:glycosyltransferase involved in cell wall biosynthesis|nr:glycosyltransferase family 4 protein [Candidatus Paceibacterota bacterium]